MISLLDREQGSTAAYLYRRMGVSPAGRIRALEGDIDSLRRYLAFNVRVPLGVELGDNRHQVDFDAFGRMHFYSSDDSVAIERNPNTKGNVVDFRVVNPGCANAYGEVCLDRGNTIAASGCDSLGIVGNDAAIAAVHTNGVSGTPDMIQFDFDLPYTAGVLSPTGWSLAKDRAGGTVKVLVHKDVTAAPSDDFDCGSS